MLGPARGDVNLGEPVPETSAHSWPRQIIRAHRRLHGVRTASDRGPAVGGLADRCGAESRSGAPFHSRNAASQITVLYGTGRISSPGTTRAMSSSTS